jgi:hypothetical protein
MSLQSIINIAETIEFSRKKVISQQVSRSGIVKVDESVTRQPWKFNIGVSAVIPYANARALMESIDYYDRLHYQDVSFSNNANLSWMFAYQGDLNATQRNNLRVTSFVGNQLVLNTLPTGNANQYILKAGDIFTLAGYPYPFTSVYDVQRGSGSTVTVTTHRPNFIAASVANLALTFGNAVSFRMIASTMPNYQLSPGGTTALVSFTGNFDLVEYTGLTQ